MMDRLRKMLAEARAIYDRMSGAQRATALMLAATVVVALVLIGWLGARPEDVVLAGNLDQSQLEEVTTALESRGEDYTVEGSSVRVPASRRPYLAKALIDEKVIPTQKVIDYETYIEAASVFGTRDRRRTLERLAQATEIERMIATIDNVATATVVLSPEGQATFLADEPDVGASISVTMRGAHELDQTTVNSIIGIVRGAVRRIDPEKITVVDTRTGRSHSSRDRDDSIVAGMELFKLQKSVEEMLADKVRRLFSRMNVACTVVVNAKLDLDKIREKAQEIAPEPHMIEEEREKVSEPGPARISGPVGTTVNTGGVLTPGGPVRTRSAGSTRDFRRSRATYSYVAKEIVKTPRGVESVTASVVLFDRTIEKGSSRVYDEGYWEKYKDDFEKQIRNAIGASATDAVAVMYMPSAAERPAELEPGEPLHTTVASYMREYSMLFVFAAVILSLGFLYSIARREGAPAAPTPEQARRRRRVPVIPPPSPELARLKEMQAQVRDVVEADPRSAAQLVQRWLSKEE